MLVGLCACRQFLSSAESFIAMSLSRRIRGVYQRLSSDVQVYILDAIAKMQIKEAKDAESIVERVVPRLQHANSAVVLSAVKVGSTIVAHPVHCQD